MTVKHNFTINQGSTFDPVLYYTSPSFTVKPITGITKSGQAKVTAGGHGIPSAGVWKVFVVGVAGMSQINSADIKRVDLAYDATYVGVDTVSLNLDTTRFYPYSSGGELLYHPPIDLTGYTARMQIREYIDDALPAISLTTENGGIVIVEALGSIQPVILDTESDGIEWATAVYDLEIVSPLGAVTRLLKGGFTLDPQVTRA